MSYVVTLLAKKINHEDSTHVCDSMMDALVLIYDQVRIKRNYKSGLISNETMNIISMTWEKDYFISKCLQRKDILKLTNAEQLDLIEVLNIAWVYEANRSSLNVGEKENVAKEFSKPKRYIDLEE